MSRLWCATLTCSSAATAEMSGAPSLASRNPCVVACAEGALRPVGSGPPIGRGRGHRELPRGHGAAAARVDRGHRQGRSDRRTANAAGRRRIANSAVWREVQAAKTATTATDPLCQRAERLHHGILPLGLVLGYPGPPRHLSDPLAWARRVSITREPASILWARSRLSRLPRMGPSHRQPRTQGAAGSAPVRVRLSGKSPSRAAASQNQYGAHRVPLV